MHRLHILDPGEGDVVIGPPPRNRNRHLVGLGPVEDPVPHGGKPLDHVERVFGSVGVEVELGHIDPMSARPSERERIARDAVAPLRHEAKHIRSENRKFFRDAELPPTRESVWHPI